MDMTFFGGILEGQKEFGHNISGIINFVLLSLVYFLGIGVTSFFALLFRKKFLELRPDKTAKTYWSELNIGEDPKENYFRQF